MIARARHAATSFSEQSANSPSGRPSCRTAVSLVISVSSESSPTAPGSRFSEASSAVPSSFPSATSASQPGRARLAQALDGLRTEGPVRPRP